MAEIIKEENLENVATENQVVDSNAEAPAFSKKPQFNKRRQNDRQKREPSDGFDRKLVQVNRVTKVVKGGKTMRFNALVVVGDKKGQVGLGMGKAAEVPTAVEKAVANAKKNLFKISIVDGTIPHTVLGKFGASSMLMLPAKEGTGVIAGSSARSVLELVGVRNIACKSYGSRNKINAVKATLEGLKNLKNKEQFTDLRGVKVEG